MFIDRVMWIFLVKYLRIFFQKSTTDSENNNIIHVLMFFYYSVVMHSEIRF